jgi:hypothetical protein
MADLPIADRHETVLPAVDPEALAALERALADDPAVRKAALEAVVAAFPTFLDAWAALAPLGSTPVERYAYARVGYHRGLDALRAAGWGGRGIVRWAREENRGLLRCLARLREAAATIGETGEVERLSAFLRELDPDWDDGNVA